MFFLIIAKSEKRKNLRPLLHFIVRFTIFYRILVCAVRLNKGLVSRATEEPVSVQDALLKSLMTKVNATLESSLRNPGAAHREALMHILF